jgi:hypothetical protein
VTARQFGAALRLFAPELIPCAILSRIAVLHITISYGEHSLKLTEVLLQKVLVNPFQGGAFFRPHRTIDIPTAFIAHGIKISTVDCFDFQN